ncbi:uncharacterized protein BP5553_06762 [Venustampulla echinocandica]|uniref:Zn(2)-C6 fungal-type domain-containing protein n=1 Tax=Venustampulla echinocandica TaxID=2656787 RepID=A0A370TKU4_9HELO|nr:uncharacterized protein BP5553_06762 [Venustampulla echinocandica]RDL36150.1 hypothetical protein BP5553_06762 [Venustampulla echinocandica]
MSMSLAAKQQQRKAARNLRAPLSCGPCRARKLKCNREEPCQNCTVRKETHSCVYGGSRCNISKNGAGAASVIRPLHVESMQKRIDRLEALVTSLASKGQDLGEPRVTPPRDTMPNGSKTDTKSADPQWGNDHSFDEIRHGVGVMKVSESHSEYRGTTHWGDVFQELNELKNVWGQVQEEQDSINLHTAFSGPAGGPPLLYGPVKPVSFEELLASVPARPALDKLIEKFFDEKDSPVPTFHMLHKPTFMQQYEEHWKTPKATKPMWLGLLFSVLSLVMLSYHLLEEEPPEYEGDSDSLSELYRLRTTQCVMLADVTKCVPYTLETLVFNAIVEQARKSDGGNGVWTMFGLITRIALQMGYHRLAACDDPPRTLLTSINRDPSQYPEISPLQGEMRRRVWFFVVRLDGLLSFQVGLPSNIRKEFYDTEQPRNIHDWELYEGMTELPPSRPNSEVTPISYLLAKNRILRSLGEIAHLLSALGPYSYDAVLKLDDDLAQSQTEVPPYLQMRPLEESMDDAPSLINRRIQLEILFHQGMCVLHRKFMAQGRLDGRFEPSRNRCIRSALSLLSLQHFLFQQAQATTKDMVRSTRHWYRFSYTSQDFILAAMILCLELRHRRVAEAANVRLTPESDDEQQGSMVLSLQKASRAWNVAQGSLREARKVYRVLSHMLEMLGIFEDDNSKVLEAAVITPPDPAQLLPPQDSPLFVDGQIPVPEADFNIDWAMWDSFIEGTSFDDVYGAMLTPPTTNSMNTGSFQFELDQLNSDLPLQGATFPPIE